jgi:hypothetical protein
MFLRQSTASQVVELGPFVDDTDFKTAETALTIANTDIKLRKEAGTTHVNKNSGGATHIANGYYHATLDATDTNTVGQLDAHVNVAGALAVWNRYYVLEEAVFDALYAAASTGLLPANVTQFNGVAATSTGGRPEVNTTHAAGTAWNSGAIGAATLASDTITAAKIAASAITRAKLAPDTGLQSIRSDTALAGAATTIDLDAAAAATNDYYNGAFILLTGGTGAGQGRFITDYDGAAKRATVDQAWITNPASGTTFAILPGGIQDVAAAVWNASRASYNTGGTFGQGVASVQGNITGNLNGNVVGDVQGSVSVGDMQPSALAEVNAEVDTALADIHLDHLIAAADPGGVVANSSFLAKLVSKSATPAFSSYTNTTDSLEALADRLPAALVSGRMDSSVGAMANDTLTAAAIASAAIDADALAAGAITANAIAADAITAAKIAAGAITNAKFAAGAIDATAVAADAIGVFAKTFGVELGSFSFEQVLRIIASATAGKSSGQETSTNVFRDLGDTKNVIVATSTAAGNRTAVTLTP